MSKKFNTRELHQMLLTEDKFISDIFSKMPLSTCELGENIFKIRSKISRNYIFIDNKVDILYFFRKVESARARPLLGEKGSMGKGCHIFFTFI